MLISTADDLVDYRREKNERKYLFIFLKNTENKQYMFSEFSHIQTWMFVV